MVDQVLERHGYLTLFWLRWTMFYRCSDCKRLEPKYESAASILGAKKKFVLAKVSCHCRIRCSVSLYAATFFLASPYFRDRLDGCDFHKKKNHDWEVSYTKVIFADGKRKSERQNWPILLLCLDWLFRNRNGNMYKIWSS